MIIITAEQKEKYPTIWKHLTEYKLQKYLENLYNSVYKQIETKKYYAEKLQGIKRKYTSKEEVLDDIEEFLKRTPEIFANDMLMLNN